MVAEKILSNIDQEIEMARELENFLERIENSSPSEGRIYVEMVLSLQRRIKILNNSIPELVRGISLAKKLPSGKSISEKTGKIHDSKKKKEFFIKSTDKSKFLKELNIEANLFKRLRKRKLESKESKEEFRKPSFYGKLSNKMFLGVSERWVKSGKFKKLSLDLKKSNMNILTTTYISMMVFSIVLAFLIAIPIAGFFVFYNLGFEFPFLSNYGGDYLSGILRSFWVVIALPIFIWISFYFYPRTEKRSIAKKIDQELPFVVIHMASISGSGIGPSQIFKIIGLSKEYIHTRKEIRKVLNQTNVYGYDLSTALRNIARTTPSVKLSELLNGISTTITSGGNMKDFFEKRSESLLLEYKLEREKFTKTAETFMDIYISIVIAAPMILLMLLVMISVSGISLGFGINQLTLLIIGIVGLVNILFLTFLHLKQPSY